MQDFLFDTPVWFLGLLGVVAVALWSSGNARQDRRLKTAGYGVVGLALAMLLVSYFVDSDREKVAKGTRAIVEAVEKKDRAAAERLLHPQANFAGMDKAALIDRIATAADQFNLKRIRVTGLDVQPSVEDMVASLSATTDVEAGVFSGPMPSKWDMVWVKSEGRWLLRDFRLRDGPGIDAQSLTARIKSKMGL